MNTITRTTNDAVLVQQNIYSGGIDNGSVLTEETSLIQFPSATFTSQKWAFDDINIVRQHWICQGDDRNVVLWNHDFDGVYTDYLLSGQQTSTNNRWQEALIMKGQQHSISYTHGYEGATWSDTPHSEMVIFKIGKPMWLQLINDSNYTLQRFAENIIEGRSMILSKQNLPLNQRMNGVIRQILDCHFTGGLKKMFLFSKCLELIVLQAEAFNTIETPHLCTSPNSAMKSAPAYISRSDKERLHYAQDYMRQNIEELPSFSEVAKAVGLSEYSLKRGFKRLFGTTVFGYVAEYRLKRAQTLLLEREQSISEIAYELGYSSPQHFSTAFKKKFGVSPTSMRCVNLSTP